MSSLTPPDPNNLKHSPPLPTLTFTYSEVLLLKEALIGWVEAGRNHNLPEEVALNQKLEAWLALHKED